VLFKEKINFKLPGGSGFTPHQDSPAYITFPARCALGRVRWLRWVLRCPCRRSNTTRLGQLRAFVVWAPWGALLARWDGEGCVLGWALLVVCAC
jgi:hypothetical protein